MEAWQRCRLPHFFVYNAFLPLAKGQYCPHKNINIITFLKYNAEIVVKQHYNCYFCTVKVLFQDMKYIFQQMKHVFQPMKYVFHLLKQTFER